MITGDGMHFCICFIINNLENTQARMFLKFDSKLYRYQYLSFVAHPILNWFMIFKKKKKLLLNVS